VPHHDFVFSLNVADESRFDNMLAVVAEALVHHAGCTGAEAVVMLEGLRHALLEGAAAGLQQCDIEFHAAGRQLEVIVCYAGGRAWRASHACP
jgi:hypothetical protein